MIKYCPECGEKLDKDFKFCPSCGTNLVNIKPFEKEEKAADIVICENCGEENEPGNIVCSSCGVKLKNPPVVAGTDPVKTNKRASERPVKKQKNQQKNNTPAKSANAKKELNTGNIAIILAAGIAVAIVLLLLAGVFDSPAPQGNVNVTQQQGTGIDLGSVQQINELEAEIKANPDNHQALLQLAHLKMDSGFYEQAIQNYREYLKVHPENPDVRIDMGVCYYNLGNYDTALEEMKQALEYKPDHQIGFLNLGIVNLAAGNIEASKDWFKKAAELNPNTEAGKRAKQLLEQH